MALNKTLVPLNFSTSLDKSKDEKLAIPSKFNRLENLEFDRLNTIRQRGGTTNTDISHSPNSPDNIRKLHMFGNELLIEAANNFYSLLPAGSTPLAANTSFGNEQAFERTTSSIRDIAAGNGDVSVGMSVAYSVPNQMECWSWAQKPAFDGTSSSGTLMYKLVDTANNVVVSRGVLETASDAAAFPTVIARTSGTTTIFYIYYLRTNGTNLDLCLKSVAVTSGAVGAVSARVVIQASYTTVSDGALFDVAYDSATDFIAVSYASATVWTLKSLLGSDGTTVSRSATQALVTGGSSYLGVAFSRNGTDVYAYATVFDGTDLKSLTMRVNSATATSSATLVSGVVDAQNTSIPIASPWSNNSVIVFYQRADRSVSDLVRSIWYVITPANGASANTPTPFATNVGIGSRPFVYNNGGVTPAAAPAICLYGTLPSDTQSTGYLFRFGSDHFFGTQNSTYIPPTILAKVPPGVSAQYNTEIPVHANVYTSPGVGLYASSEVVHIPIIRRGRASLRTVPHAFGSAGALIDDTPNALAVLDVTFDNPPNSLQAQRTLFMAGANPSIWDGERIHEAGFHYYPQDVVLTQSTNAAGKLTLTNEYFVVFTYEWVDAQGVTHRSAPSVPVGITLTGTNNYITAAVPYLGLTSKQRVTEGTEKQVTIVPWVSVGNPPGGTNTIYYRAPGDAYNGIVLYNNVLGSGRASIPIGFVTDDDLISNELLYTTGGAFENEAFPPSLAVCLHQNRVWSIIADNTLQYTDEIDERFFAPATSESYQVRIPPNGGKVTALASMDDKLVVFCERQIFAIFGEGPNRLGQQSTLSNPQCVSAQLGCPLGYQDSVILEPNGVWFYSNNDGGGVRMLSRNLSIQMDPEDPTRFLGASADSIFSGATNGDIIACSNELKSQLRWYINRGTSGLVVVYNYEQRKWSTFTPVDSSGGAVSARGSFWHASTTELFEMSNEPGGLDNSQGVPVVAETAWIDVAGKLGFERIYRLQVLGTLTPGNVLTVEVGYDYAAAYTESSTYILTLPSISSVCVALKIPSATGGGNPGDEVDGNTSGATGTLVVRDGDYWIVSGVTGTFQVGEDVIAPDSGAHGTVTEVGTAWTLTSGGGAVGDSLYVIGTDIVGLITFISGPNVVVTGTGVETAVVDQLITTNSDISLLNIQHHLKNQKCTAVRFRFSTTSSNLEVVRFSAFTLQVGVKQGINKTPAARRF